MKVKAKKTPGLDLVKMCCHVLDEKKAQDVRVLDVTEQSSITDYLILATATSEPHLRALRVELEKALDSDHCHIVGMETAQESGWMVIDVFDVMIHLFLAEPRAHYSLERLWRDAVDLPVAKLLAPAKAPAAKTPAAKAAKPAKRAPARARKKS